MLAERIGDGLRHDDLCGEMDDRLDSVLGEELGHEILVAEIAEDQRDAVGHGGAKAGRQIVEHHHLPAGSDEFEYRVAADVTGAPVTRMVMRRLPLRLARPFLTTAR